MNCKISKDPEILCSFMVIDIKNNKFPPAISTLSL